MSGTGPFGREAARHWAAGLPIIPLHPFDLAQPDGTPDVRKAGKAPVLSGWQAMASRMPTLDEQAMWLRLYGDRHNMGLPTGPASGIVGIDIDHTDPAVVHAIERMLPVSTWHRVGQKGKIIAFRFTGEKSVNIQDPAGRNVVEILSLGRQMVLPPSIHPVTLKPYWASADLVDVAKSLPVLPRDAEDIIRDALMRAGVALKDKSAGVGIITTMVSAGGRDTQMMRVAGMFALEVLRGSRTLNEALGQMDAWVVNFTAVVDGDAMDPAKGRQKLVEFLIRDIRGPKKAKLPPGWDIDLLPETKTSFGLDDIGRDAQVYDAATIERFVDAGAVAIEREKPDTAAQFTRLADEIALMVFQNQDLSTTETNLIAQAVSRVTNGIVSAGVFRRRIKELLDDRITGEDHTEIAKAVVSEMSKFGEIRTNNGFVWQWAGSHWSRLDDVAILTHIAENYGQSPAAKRQSDHAGILKIMRTLTTKSLGEIEIRGVNFVNGVLLENGDMVAHDPRYGMTTCLQYRYRPELADKIPRFTSFLTDCWGVDPDFADKLIGLQQALGVTLFGAAIDGQRAFCANGQANSGKSVLIKIVEGMIPVDAVTSVHPERWNDKFSPSSLGGKMLNLVGELSENSKIPSSQFKLIVDGTGIEAQFKGKDAFTLKPVAAHWSASNHVPKFTDADAGNNRRWLFWRFNKIWPESQKVVNLEKIILAEEREAIAAWAVEGYMSWKKGGCTYHESAGHRKIMKAMEVAGDSVLFFLRSRLEAGQMVAGEQAHASSRAPTWTALEKLWQDYRAFCVGEASVSPVPRTSFDSRMEMMGANFGFTLDMSPAQGGVLVRKCSLLTYATAAGLRAVA